MDSLNGIDLHPTNELQSQSLAPGEIFNPDSQKPSTSLLSVDERQRKEAEIINRWQISTAPLGGLGNAETGQLGDWETGAVTEQLPTNRHAPLATLTSSLLNTLFPQPRQRVELIPTPPPLPSTIERGKVVALAQIQNFCQRSDYF